MVVVVLKYGSSTVDADHVKLIAGEDDETTFDYSCDVINGVDVYAYSDSTFFNKYSGYKELH